MKKLRDICLDVIGNNLHGSISSLVRDLSFYHKEILLERLIAHDYLTLAYLPHITYNLFCSSLRKICFYQSVQVTDDILEKLSYTGCQLFYLRIYDCPNVTDCGIRHITDNQHSLQILKLESLPKFTGCGLDKLSTDSLEEVSLNDCKSLCSQNLFSFFKRNKKIQILSVANCRSLDCQIFEVISNNVTNIKELNLNDFHTLNDESLIQLANTCYGIKKLHLLGCNQISIKGLSEILSNCKDLTKLDISYCSKLNNPEFLCLLKNCKNISSVAMVGLQFTDEEILRDVLVNLSNLKKLKLAGVPALTDDSIFTIMKSIGSKLVCFNLNGSINSNVTDVGLAAIARYCCNLNYLGLSMIKCSGKTLLPLFNNPKQSSLLTELHLSSTKIAEEVLYSISSHCSSLKYLSVTAVQEVNDDFLVNVAQNCKLLTGISLKNCRQLTDNGIIELALHCPLRELVLSGVNLLTDRCINVLRDHCPYLKELYVAGCHSISKEALEKLKNAVNQRLYLHPL